MSTFDNGNFPTQQTLAQQLYAHQLNIDTPEQVELQFAVAGLGSRFLAVLLDQTIIGVTLFIELLIFVWIGDSASKSHAHVSDTMTAWIIGIIIFLNFAFAVGYFAIFETYWNGQTPGKRVMKLRVIKDTGRQITFFEALTREALRLIDYLPSLYLTGVITMLCNKQNKRLGDLAAGTIVVHEPREEAPLLPQHNAFLPVQHNEWKDPAPPSFFAADAIAKLQPADLTLIDTFFTRALDLNLEVRAAMALRIAQQMATKMNLSLPEGNPERMLEAIAVAMRSGGSSR